MAMYRFPDHIHARIMVVDDHPNTASTLARAFGHLGTGIEAVAAVGGKQALELANDKPVDILITDWMMPEVNGLELIEKLQTNPERRPVYIIMITAYDVASLKMNAQHLHVDEIIMKPVRPERICQLVADAIKKYIGPISFKMPDGIPA